MGELFEDGGCISSNNPLLHPFELPIAFNWPSLKIAKHASFNITQGRPICPSFMYYLDPNEDPSEKFYLLVNGSLYREDNSLTDPEDYCFDVDENANTILPAVCFPQTDDDYTNSVEEEIYRLYPYGMLISIPFLLLTLLVYISLKQLRNLHGCCLMSQVSSLLIGYTCLVILQIASETIGNTSCRVIGEFFIILIITVNIALIVFTHLVINLF
ncbi:hypothetical protein O3M35_010693 [Rhynocoris fuscipes]|uniref:G-protein coupled receptor Mth2 n=1 Tax=Rhynocoris fuscipes TaxID=488301 RepID=A0AAW1D2N5_9HEMI